MFLAAKLLSQLGLLRFMHPSERMAYIVYMVADPPGVSCSVFIFFALLALRDRMSKFQMEPWLQCGHCIRTSRAFPCPRNFSTIRIARMAANFCGDVCGHLASVPMHLLSTCKVRHAELFKGFVFCASMITSNCMYWVC